MEAVMLSIPNSCRRQLHITLRFTSHISRLTNYFTFIYLLHMLSSNAFYEQETMR